MLSHGGEAFDILLFNAPVLAWSRYSIPSGAMPKPRSRHWACSLARMSSPPAQLALVDYLYSPDQLPRSFVDTWQLMRELGAAARSRAQPQARHARARRNQPLPLRRALHRRRAVAVRGAASRYSAGTKGRHARRRAEGVGQTGRPQPGAAAHRLHLPAAAADSYHSPPAATPTRPRGRIRCALRSPLQTTLGITADKLRAVIGPFHERRLEEFRIGFGPRDQDLTYHGVVWPLLGNEDENTDVVGEIETVLRDCGLKGHRLPRPHLPLRVLRRLRHADVSEQGRRSGAPELPDPGGDAPSQTLH